MADSGGQRVADQIAEVNGARLRFRISGQGPLAVFGHGLLGSLEQFEAEEQAMAELRQQVRLLLYDARGHGQSTGPEDPAAYTWATMGEDMATLVHHLGEDSAIVGGASMGAGAALWVALERPELVRALVLAIPPPLGPDSMRAEEERQAIQSLGLLAMAIETFGLEQAIELAKQYPGFASNPEEAAERARLLAGHNPRYLVPAIRGLISAPVHDPSAYRSIRVPLLVLAHEGDPLHPVRAAKLLQEMASHAVVRLAPEPGYWPAHPAEFVAEVKEFLRSAL